MYLVSDCELKGTFLSFPPLPLAVVPLTLHHVPCLPGDRVLRLSLVLPWTAHHCSPLCLLPHGFSVPGSWSICYGSSWGVQGVGAVALQTHHGLDSICHTLGFLPCPFATSLRPPVWPTEGVLRRTLTPAGLHVPALSSWLNCISSALKLEALLDSPLLPAMSVCSFVMLSRTVGRHYALYLPPHSLGNLGVQQQSHAVKILCDFGFSSQPFPDFCEENSVQHHLGQCGLL